jgi:hypothetical protein
LGSEVGAEVAPVKVARAKPGGRGGVDLKGWLLAERRRYIYQDLIKSISHVRTIADTPNDIRLAAVDGIADYLDSFGPVSEEDYISYYLLALEKGQPLPPKVPSRYFWEEADYIEENSISGTPSYP